jgi:hypothetical protein
MNKETLRMQMLAGIITESQYKRKLKEEMDSNIESNLIITPSPSYDDSTHLAQTKKGWEMIVNAIGQLPQSGRGADLGEMQDKLQESGNFDLIYLEAVKAAKILRKASQNIPEITEIKDHVPEFSDMDLDYIAASFTFNSTVDPYDENYDHNKYKNSEEVEFESKVLSKLGLTVDDIYEYRPLLDITGVED